MSKHMSGNQGNSSLERYHLPGSRVNGLRGSVTNGARDRLAERLLFVRQPLSCVPFISVAARETKEEAGPPPR